jgi:hypothetical protein
MVKNKILSIKNGSTINVYSLNCNNSRLNEYLNKINEKYRLVINDKITTTLYGGKPQGFGIYDYKPNTKVINYHVNHIDTSVGVDRSLYEPIGGDGINMLDFLTPAEQSLLIPIGGPQDGELSVEVEYTSNVYLILKEMIDEKPFSKGKNLIDFTKLIKLYNGLNNIPNNFIYDGTIDMVKGDGTSKNPNRKFFDVESYHTYLQALKENLNKDSITINENEKNMTNECLHEIIKTIIDLIDIKLLGTIVISENNVNINQEILKRFGYRNEGITNIDSFIPLLSKLQIAPIDDNSTLSDMRFDYDLDAINANNTIMGEIEDHQEQSSVLRMISKMGRTNKH